MLSRGVLAASSPDMFRKEAAEPLAWLRNSLRVSSKLSARLLGASTHQTIDKDQRRSSLPALVPVTPTMSIVASSKVDQSTPHVKSRRAIRRPAKPRQPYVDPARPWPSVRWHLTALAPSVPQRGSTQPAVRAAKTHFDAKTFLFRFSRSCQPPNVPVTVGRRR